MYSSYFRPIIFALTAAGVGLSFWVMRGTYVAAAHGTAVDIAFTPAPLWVLPFVIAIAGAVLAVVHRAVRAAAVGQMSERADIACLTPLILCIVPAAAPLLADGHVTHALPAAPYVLIDLRAWWAGAGLALWLVAIDRRTGAALTSSLTYLRDVVAPRLRFPLADFLLAALVIAFAISSTPLIRFSKHLHGDEPKYVRYCENFYQGRGLDLSTKQPLGDQWRTERPALLNNVRHVVSATVAELSNLVHDVRAALGDRQFRWMRAGARYDWFLRGKQGGFFQVHNPGLPFLMCGAYTIDRAWLARTRGYQDEFPAELAAVYWFQLVMHGAWAIALFRLLRCVSTSLLAWVLAAAAMLSLPVAAMPFQIYPEAAAGLIITLVVHHVLFGTGGGAARAAGYGLLAGYLPWLHVRFLPVALVLVAAMLVVHFRRVRRVTAYALGFAAAIGALCFYAYHLTGSLRPDAMYHLRGSGWSFRLDLVPMGVVGYLFDRFWGLLAHAPLYLFAIAGLRPLWQRHRGSVVLLVVAWLALAIPAAGHGTLGGASPLRHLVAVVPLAAIPIAVVLSDRASRRWTLAFAFVMAVSMQNAAAYNAFHIKETGRLIDRSGTGWKTNLLLPWTHADPWEQSSANFVLFLCWVGAAAALVALPGARREANAHVHSESRSSWMAAALPITLVVIASLAAAATGDRMREDYLPVVISQGR